VGAGIVASAESAFDLGMLIGAGLMAAGGAVALAGVRNPERPAPEPSGVPPAAAAAAGECGRPAERPAPSAVPGTLAPEGASAAPDPVL
jgi:hypothetical protein